MIKIEKILSNRENLFRSKFPGYETHPRLEMNNAIKVPTFSHYQIIELYEALPSVELVTKSFSNTVKTHYYVVLK